MRHKRYAGGHALAFPTFRLQNAPVNFAVDSKNVPFLRTVLYSYSKHNEIRPFPQERFSFCPATIGC